MKDNLSELNEAADLPAIIAELYPDSKAQPGREGVYFAVWRGNTKTPSFSVFKHNGVWLYSDKGNTNLDEPQGNAYQFLIDVEKMTHQEAVDFLSERSSGHIRPSFGRSQKPKEEVFKPAYCESSVLDDAELARFRKMFRASKGFPKSFENRGFTAKDIAKYGVINDDGAGIFPIFDPEGRVVAFKKRLLATTGRRYTYCQERGRGGSPAACFKGSSEDLFIIEGELNAMIFHSLSPERNVQGLAGTNGGIWKGSATGRNVYLYLDSAPEYGDTVDTYVKTLRHDDCHDIYLLECLPDEKDFCDLAAEGRDSAKAAIDALVKDAEQLYQHDPGSRIIGNFTVNELQQRKLDLMEGKIFYRFGWPEMDNKTYGIPPVGITLFAALSGHGKSTWLRQVLYSLSQNVKIKLYTSDESADLILAQLTTLASGVPLDVVRKKTHIPHVIDTFGSVEKARERWSEVFDWFCYQHSDFFAVGHGNDVEAICQDITMSKEKGFEVFGVDFIQDLKYKRQRDDDISMSLLKECLQINKVPLLLGAQLAKSKFGYDRLNGAPVSTDIDGKGSIYQYSEAAIFGYNQDAYMKDFNLKEESYFGYDWQLKGLSRMYIHKNRSGPKDHCDLKWVADIPMYLSRM